MKRAATYLFAVFLLVASILFSAMLFQWHAEGRMDPYALARVAFVLIGIAVLVRVALGDPKSGAEPLLCPRCGSRIFETRSPMVLVPLLTCFGCGLEVQVRASESPRGPSRRGQAPGAA